MIKRRRLFFDIETSYLIVKSFYLGRKVHLDYKSVIKESKIICICYKWEGEREVSYLTWDKAQDDKKMIQAFIKVANSADEIVAHNGDRFDIAWIRTRCIKHGIEMFPSYVTTDTLKAARSKFRFPSNKLDFIGGYLEIGNKIKVDLSLWDNIILNKCAKSLAKMVSYCKMDVRLLERVYLAMKNHLPAKTHPGNSPVECPECGSGATKISKPRISAAGVKKIQFQCNDCGKYHTISEKEWNKNKT